MFSLRSKGLQVLQRSLRRGVVQRAASLSYPCLFSPTDDNTATNANSVRSFSSSGGLPPGMLQAVREAEAGQPEAPPSTPPEYETVNAVAPDKLDQELMEYLLSSVQVIVQRGITHQRLEQLAAVSYDEMSVVEKWQKMMEIYFTTQLQVAANLGYAPDETGLQLYTYHMQEFLGSLDQSVENPNNSKSDKNGHTTHDENGQLQGRTLQLHFKHMRRVTWRQVVATAFGLDLSHIPELTIVEARNHMHAVADKMSSPEILLQVQKKVSRIQYDSDDGMENMMKHTALQQIIVNQVYEPLLPTLGFTGGADDKSDDDKSDDDKSDKEAKSAKDQKQVAGRAYASFQCALADFEGDPLIQEYTSVAMRKLWEAAGLNIDEVLSPGASPRATP